ncbi:hypothetical protein C8R47DRAFT_1229346 [Mycena vitilis]|nr:hypothetical protein C8R47DRAFT_1229542 [Mycena vitilis]KAJ6452704.1 hypothetical protein C8R47DRAFT_1229346 [Mycena vitilis]
MTPLSVEIYWRVAMFSDEDVRLNLLQTSRPVYTHLRALRYRYIAIGSDAKHLVRSLSNNTALPPLDFQVKSLMFLNRYARVDAAQWARVLPAMTNLGTLIISPRIPLSLELIPRLTFRLLSFGSSSSLEGAWVDFLATQHWLDELVIDDHLVGDAPGPQRLPLLRSIKGRPRDLAKFAHYPRLLDLWFYSVRPYSQCGLQPEDLQRFAASSVQLVTVRLRPSQLLLLLDAAPALLQALQHLVLDEERDWSDFIVNVHSLQEHWPLTQVATRLSTFGALKTILLVCVWQAHLRVTPRRLLERTDGPLISSAMSVLCTSSSLRTFHFFAFDGSAIVTNWTTDDEEVFYRPQTDSPGVLDDHYSYLY